MDRHSQEVQRLVERYEQQLSKAPVPLWMDVEELLEVLEFYFLHQQDEEYEQCLSLALRLHPNHPDLLIRKAYGLKNRGAVAEAIALVDALPNQESFEVLRFRAEIALQQLDFVKSERLFLSAIEAVSDRSSAIDGCTQSEGAELSMHWLMMGELFLDNGAILYAERYFSKIPATATEYNRAQMLLAECAYQFGRNEEALSMLSQLLDEEPYYLEAWVKLADFCYELQRFERAVDAANFALAIHPTHETALRLKASALLGLERYDDVLEVCTAYRQSHPNDYAVALTEGEILLNRYQIAAARAVLKQAHLVCPNDNADKTRILADIATTYALEGKMPEAFEYLLACCSLGTPHADVLLQGIQMGLLHKDYPFALQLLSSYSKKHPLTEEARFQIAQWLYEASLIEQVEPFWEWLLQTTPDATIKAAPYLAFAAGYLHRQDAFLAWIRCAYTHYPELTREVFSHLGSPANIDELLRRMTSGTDSGI